MKSYYCRYVRELTIAKEALHQEKLKVKTLQSKLRETSADVGSGNESIEHQEQNPDQTQFISELLGVREKLNVLQKASQTLKVENQILKVSLLKHNLPLCQE